MIPASDADLRDEADDIEDVARIDFVLRYGLHPI